MKFSIISVAGLIMPLAVLAAAAPAPAPVAEAVALLTGSPEELGLTKRTTEACKIVNSSSSTVNCRSGPGFSYTAVGTVTVGTTYTFSCYKSGDCYNSNCTWDRVALSGGGYCYVNGYYTDSKCSAANLGTC